MILAQYYNFLRLGREGYTQVLDTMRTNARYSAKNLDALEKFNIINDATHTPCFCVSLKDESRYNAADLAKVLSQEGWTIPAFSLPANASTTNTMRTNVKETFALDMADILAKDIKNALKKLDSIDSQPYQAVGTNHN